MHLAANHSCETVGLAHESLNNWSVIQGNLYIHIATPSMHQQKHDGTHAYAVQSIHVSLTCCLNCTALSLQDDGQRANHYDTINSIPLWNIYPVLVWSDIYISSPQQSPFLPNSAWDQSLTIVSSYSQGMQSLSYLFPFKIDTHMRRTFDRQPDLLQPISYSVSLAHKH